MIDAEALLCNVGMYSILDCRSRPVCRWKDTLKEHARRVLDGTDDAHSLNLRQLNGVHRKWYELHDVLCAVNLIASKESVTGHTIIY